MAVEKKETEYVANLARLGLTTDEKELFTNQLNHILSYIDVINSVNTESISSDSIQLIDAAASAPLREDTAVLFSGKDKILEAAPQVEDNMFKVPRML